MYIRKDYPAEKDKEDFFFFFPDRQSPLNTAAPNHNSVQGSINSDVMLVREVGGDGRAGHPVVSTASRGSFLF